MATARIFERLLQSSQEIETTLNNDGEIKFALADREVHFALRSDEPNLFHIHLRDGAFAVSSASSSDQVFTLMAPEEAWHKFFSKLPPPPYQSFWGMMRVLGENGNVRVEGESAIFARNARVWRLVLDRIHDVLHGRSHRPFTIDFDNETDQDSIVGRYVWIDSEHFGKCKIFYESSGKGSQTVLLMHTAGADSRQYHALMSMKELQSRFTMIAFDMPGHGRSSPGSRIVPQGYRLTEASYVDTIKSIIAKLQIRGCILSGASMAGHICLAVALRAAELGVIGVIPCEACDHVSSAGTLYGVASANNEAILNAEIVTGLAGPQTSVANQRMIWWGYSSQAAGIFAGDLLFYFDA